MDNDVVFSPLPGSVANFEDENGIEDPHPNMGHALSARRRPSRLPVTLHASWRNVATATPPSFHSRAEVFISLACRWYCNLRKIKIFDNNRNSRVN